MYSITHEWVNVYWQITQRFQDNFYLYKVTKFVRDFCVDCLLTENSALADRARADEVLRGMSNGMRSWP